MLGKVYGPYTKTNPIVTIVLHNEDGSVKSQTRKCYNTYLKEKEEGLHDYEDYIPLTNYEIKNRNFQRRIEYFNRVKEEFNLPIITKNNKEVFYYPDAYEIEKIPGYYYMPLEGSVYAIDKQGGVINIGTNTVLKNRLSSDGYLTCAARRILNTGTIVTSTISIHRILALLFVPKPDRHMDKSYDELQVNHKDGIKTNNYLDNLEWVSHIENLDHAVINGLSTVNDVAKPVLAKNIITGEIKRYLSVGTCARDFEITQGRLSKHLNSIRYGSASVDNYIFKYDNDQPWPSRPPIVKNNRGYFRTVPGIVVKNIVTNESFIFNSVTEAIKHFNLSKDGTHNHIKKYGKDVPYKDYLFFNLDEFKNSIKH